MGQSVLTDFRSRVVGARGRVLELGIGSGRNLPFYGGADEVVGVDPSAELLAMARRAAAASPHRVDLIERTAERLPLPDGSFDTEVT